MKKFFINNFLQTGKVDFIDVGMTVDQFKESAINAKKGIILNSQDELSIFYNYEKYDVTFYRGTLVSISLDLNPGLKDEYMIHTSEGNKPLKSITALSEFIHMLNAAKISWEFQKVENGKNVYLLTEGNITVVFSFVENGEELCHIAKQGLPSNP